MKSAFRYLFGNFVLPALAVIVAWSCIAPVETQSLDRRLTALESSRLAAPAPMQIPTYEDRAIDLPEDGNTWHTSLFLRKEWESIPAERKVHTLFFTEKGLISLRTQTHWHLTTTNSPEYDKFAQLVTVTPCLLVQRANGEVIYRESGSQLAHDNDGLVRAIRKEVQRHCPDGRCLPLHPAPGPDEEKPAEEIPAIVQETPPEKKSPLAAIIAGGAGLLGGVAGHWRKGG